MSLSSRTTSAAGSRSLIRMAVQSPVKPPDDADVGPAGADERRRRLGDARLTQPPAANGSRRAGQRAQWSGGSQPSSTGGVQLVPTVSEPSTQGPSLGCGNFA